MRLRGVQVTGTSSTSRAQGLLLEATCAVGLLQEKRKVTNSELEDRVFILEGQIFDAMEYLGKLLHAGYPHLNLLDDLYGRIMQVDNAYVVPELRRKGLRD